MDPDISIEGAYPPKTCGLNTSATVKTVSEKSDISSQRCIHIWAHDLQKKMNLTWVPKKSMASSMIYMFHSSFSACQWLVSGCFQWWNRVRLQQMSWFPWKKTHGFWPIFPTQPIQWANSFRAFFAGRSSEPAPVTADEKDTLRGPLFRGRLEEISMVGTWDWAECQAKPPSPKLVSSGRYTKCPSCIEIIGWSSHLSYGFDPCPQNHTLSYQSPGWSWCFFPQGPFLW